MNVEVRIAPETEKTQIEQMLDSYLGELGRFREDPVGAWSATDYPYLKYYWTEPERYPFTIWADGELAGFALVRQAEEKHSNTMQVAEFFIEPKFRRRGVGTNAAAAIWRKFPGRWELQVMRRNRPAMEFWKLCVQTYAQDCLTEEIQADDGRRTVFHFGVGAA